MAGGSKRLPNEPKPETESKSKEEDQEQKEETQTESKPEDGDSTSNAEAKGKGKKPMTPKSKSPIVAAKKGRGKGIVIEEPKNPEPEPEPEPATVEKSGMKRKRESTVVNSSYSLRSGKKGSGVGPGQRKVVARKSAVRKVKGKKKMKEEEAADVLEEGSCKRQSKRLKRNDDKDKDDHGSGSGSVKKPALRMRASK